MNRKEHWDAIYSKKRPEETSWFLAKPEESLRRIRETGLAAGRVLDVGGGGSSLASELLKAGFEPSVLDVSEEGLRAARERMGEEAARVHWIAADVLEACLPPGSFDVWHDRALFHFLTEPAERRRYVEQMTRALKPEGHAILAAFHVTGPETCSGLPVIRYSAESLSREVGPGFKLRACSEEAHRTPWGSVQNFISCHFQKLG